MLTLDEALGEIQACDDLDRLETTFLTLSRRLGFDSFSYIDVRRMHETDALPFFQTNVRDDFARLYRDEGFFVHDPVATRAATSNAPFRWADIAEFSHPVSKRGVKSKSRKVLEVAFDHGLTEGYVLPVHAMDAYGRPASSLISLFWTERAEDMVLGQTIPNWFRLVALSYHERVLALRGARDGVTEPPPPLTDRERDCLLWACRGKTNVETGMILNISERTVKFHMENAMQKLGVHNKFHAIAMAIHLGIIAP